MYELSDDPRHPTLSERLRDAAVDRAREHGNVVDEVVIDETGVIDLRFPDYTELGSSTTEPAAALASTRGELDSAIDVSALYAPEHEPKGPWWRLGRPRTGEKSATSSPGLAALPVSEEIDLRDESAEAPVDGGPECELFDIEELLPLDAHETVVVDRAEPEAEAETEEVEAEPEDVVVERPTDVCPDCGGEGERDLFDPFSQTDYFSCDDCQNMWQSPHT